MLPGQEDFSFEADPNAQIIDLPEPDFGTAETPSPEPTVTTPPLAEDKSAAQREPSSTYDDRRPQRDRQERFGRNRDRPRDRDRQGDRDRRPRRPDRERNRGVENSSALSFELIDPRELDSPKHRLRDERPGEKPRQGRYQQRDRQHHSHQHRNQQQQALATTKLSIFRRFVLWFKKLTGGEKSKRI